MHGEELGAGVQSSRVSFASVTQRFHLNRVSGSGARGSGNNELTALDDVDLEIPQGQFIALVGASGCGKTTLLNMVAGLVAPTEGTVSVMGSRPKVPNLDIGYMFARDALLPWRTALKNVCLPLEVRKWPRAAARERAMATLDLVGLRGREGQYRAQLSQGMRQRVALARTLAPNPRILLMDEPFAALDARTKASLQGEFLGIWEAAATEDAGPPTVVFVTHDLNEAVLMADRVMVMLPSPGRIAADITVDLPRPRAQNLEHVAYTPQFAHLTERLLSLLEGALPVRAQDRQGAQ